ncbi:MAG: transposase [Myxococcales bacterium]|nr:transposase [Myxococcales bacterium]
MRLVLDEGKSVGQVARDLDLTPSALGGRVKQARADRSKGKAGLTTEERAELAALRKDLRVVKMERDILGKAFFAKENARSSRSSWRRGPAGRSR